MNARGGVKQRKRRAKAAPTPAFTAHAPDKQTPWMALAQDSGRIPNLNIEDDEPVFLQTRDRPDWDKNSGFIRKQTDVEINQAMVRKVKLLYESNPVVSNAVDIFLREIWRGGISITVHFGEKEKMVFSAQDRMTKQYFSERLNPEIKRLLRDCILYGFACVRVHPPKMVEVEVEEVSDDPDAYVDEEALKAAMPNSKEELLRLLDEEIRNGASFAGDNLQAKTDGEGSRFFDGEKDIQVSAPVRRLEGSNQLIYDDPDPEAVRARQSREEFYKTENVPSVESLKSQLLAVRQSNLAARQLARGIGGGQYPDSEQQEDATGDDDLDSYPSFTVLDMDRVTQFIRLNDQDRREYYVSYNGHQLNRTRQPVPQGMMVILKEPTLEGILQSGVAKVLPLANQLRELWNNHSLVSHAMARPFFIASVETDKSDPHVASRTMTFGNAAQEGTDEALKKYSHTVEIRRQQVQESHEIVVDSDYEALLQEKQERIRLASTVGQQQNVAGITGRSDVHPLMDSSGYDDPTDLRDEPYKRKCVLPANSKLLPNPVPAVLGNMLDVARYLSEQIFIALNLPAEMYQGGQRKFAAHATNDRLIQDSSIQEHQNALSTLLQTLLSRVFDPLVDEKIYNMAMRGGFQTNSRYLKRYKELASILVEFHFNVQLTIEQLVAYVEQGWLEEKAAQTFALRQASIDPKFASPDPAAARRKRVRETAQEEERPRTDMERAKIQSAEKIASENRKSAERTAKQNAAAKASEKPPPAKKQK